MSMENPSIGKTLSILEESQMDNINGINEKIYLLVTDINGEGDGDMEFEIGDNPTLDDIITTLNDCRIMWEEEIQNIYGVVSDDYSIEPTLNPELGMIYEVYKSDASYISVLLLDRFIRTGIKNVDSGELSRYMGGSFKGLYSCFQIVRGLDKLNQIRWSDIEYPSRLAHDIAHFLHDNVELHYDIQDDKESWETPYHYVYHHTIEALETTEGTDSIIERFREMIDDTPNIVSNDPLLTLYTRLIQFRTGYF